MSKVSEFAEAMKVAGEMRPRHFEVMREKSGDLKIPQWVASVFDSGSLHLHDIIIEQDEALALAKWINENYGESE